MRLLGLRFSPMSSRLLKIDEKNFAEVIQDAARVILSGGVVAVPTESLYGLAVHALNERAVERLYAVKGRREDNPLLILIPSKESLDRYVTKISEKARTLMERFWPGGLTMVFFAAPILPSSLTAGTGKIRGAPLQPSCSKSAREGSGSARDRNQCEPVGPAELLDGGGSAGGCRQGH